MSVSPVNSVISGHLPQLRLRKGLERRVLSGHPWVFSNELESQIGEEAEPGGLATLVTSSGSPVATVYHNPSTLIACRVLTRSREPVDQRFFSRRISEAVDLRRRIYPGLHHLRLVYSESDYLPGLVVDRYGGWLSIQILTAGMEKLKGMVLQSLQDELQPEGIVLRGDSPYRLLEGLDQGQEVIRHGSTPVAAGEGDIIAVEIVQNGCRFAVDLLRGQKTGFFYDQRENRQLLDRLIQPGQSVADLCCYTGSWAIKAACLGAAAVLGIDSSAPALQMAGENARLNGVSNRVEWCRGDALKTAREMAANGRLFDLVVLDPPPLARSRKGLTDAARKYEKLNVAAMRLVSSGGSLLTASCSHLIGREAFRKILAAAAGKSGRDARLLSWGGQAMDHPVLPIAPETEYLQFALLKIN
jgi:23S rRNA (cytosine1962-C5)-methyltransferase